MSFRVIGYQPNGSRITEDQGPGRARVSGWGGSLAQSLTVAKPPPKRLPRQELGRMKHWGPLCLKTLARDGGPCHRSENHKGTHASEMAMRNLARRRRLAL